MDLTKKQKELLDYLIQHEEEITSHFNEQMKLEDLFKLFDLKYGRTDKKGNDTKLQRIKTFVNITEDGTKKDRTYTMIEFNYVFFDEKLKYNNLNNSYFTSKKTHNKTQKVKEITEQELIDSLQKLDNSSLKKIFARNLVMELFSRLVLTSDGRIDTSSQAWFVTDRELYKATGIVSNLYDHIERNPKLFYSYHYDTTYEHIDVVYEHLEMEYKWLKQFKHRTLEYLRKDLHIITYQDNAYILQETIIKTDEFGTGKPDTKTTYPTLDEIEWINHTVIPKALQNMSEHDNIRYKNLNDVYKNKKMDEFYNTFVVDYINQNAPIWWGWGTIVGIQKCNRIGFNFDIINDYTEDERLQLNEHDKEEFEKYLEIQQEQIQEMTVEQRQESTVERHEKALQGKGKGKWTITRQKKEFVEIGHIVNTSIHNSKYKYNTWIAKQKLKEEGREQEIPQNNKQQQTEKKEIPNIRGRIVED